MNLDFGFMKAHFKKHISPMNIQLHRKKVVLHFIVLWVCLGYGTLSAQQQALHTMFMYNKLLVNPAYAGYHDHACASAIVREQWLGFEGAPKSQAISFNTPLSSQSLGLGFNLQHNSIGISSSTTLDAIYDYRFPVGNGTLSLGVQGSGRFLYVDYNDPAVKAIQDINIDPGVDINQDNKFIANVGAGIYYSTSTFYVGLSSPRLMASDIDFEVNNLFTSREQAHYYLMTGVALALDHRMSFVPQVMVRYTEAAPVSVDLNLGLRWGEDHSVGVSFRKGANSGDEFLESIDIMASAKILRGLRLGAAYDFTMSELQRYGDGSIEVMLMYCFGEAAKPATFVNPRYF
jgi:type IX secretion system PorP/SprF family membrane protein